MSITCPGAPGVLGHSVGECALFRCPQAPQPTEKPQPDIVYVRTYRSPAQRVALFVLMILVVGVLGYWIGFAL